MLQNGEKERKMVKEWEKKTYADEKNSLSEWPGWGRREEVTGCFVSRQTGRLLVSDCYALREGGKRTTCPPFSPRLLPPLPTTGTSVNTSQARAQWCAIPTTEAQSKVTYLEGGPVSTFPSWSGSTWGQDGEPYPSWSAEAAGLPGTKALHCFWEMEGGEDA